MIGLIMESPVAPHSNAESLYAQITPEQSPLPHRIMPEHVGQQVFKLVFQKTVAFGFRLTQETIAIDGGDTIRSTYYWNKADNLDTYQKYVNGVRTSYRECYFNNLNQLYELYDMSTFDFTEYTYDANGARKTKSYCEARV